MAFDPPDSEKRLPLNTTDGEFLQFIVKFAIFAPSGHNTQPWLFRVNDAELHLLADRTRALPVVDPHDRALTISCGAALDPRLVATRRFGRAFSIDKLPSADPDHLATIRLAEIVSPSSEDIALFKAIPNRRTTRAMFEARDLPVKLLEECHALAEANGAELTIIQDGEHRSRIAELVAEGDRKQFGDRRFRQELAAWVHSRRGDTKDGMSGESFGMPDLLSPLGALVIRTFDLGNGIAAGDRKKIAEGSPVLAVFSTKSDQATDWIATGQALSKVLLKLSASGATASFLNQPIEVDELRPRLGNLIGVTGIPQLLLRFGYGKPVPATARRPVEDVLV